MKEELCKKQRVRIRVLKAGLCAHSALSVSASKQLTVSFLHDSETL